MALLAAAGAVCWLPIASPFWRVAAADGVGTLVVFGFSRAANNTSIYDPYWSVAPIAMALEARTSGLVADARSAGIRGAAAEGGWPIPFA